MPPSVLQAVIADTCETAIAWEQFEDFHETVKAETEALIRQVAGHPGAGYRLLHPRFPGSARLLIHLERTRLTGLLNPTFCLGPERLCNRRYAPCPPRYLLHRTLNGQGEDTKRTMARPDHGPLGAHRVTVDA